MHFTFKTSYWSDRYEDDKAPWDLNHISRPIKEYIDHIENKESKILIPGAGPGHEVSYLHQQGFKHVYYLDFSQKAAEEFAKKEVGFPALSVLVDDFFEHKGIYDLILEQTFFCAFEPTENARKKYVHKMFELLRPGGLLVGVWWSFPLKSDKDEPPYGGSREEYKRIFSEKFNILKMDECYNSEPERMGKEYFCVFKKEKD